MSAVSVVLITKVAKFMSLFGSVSFYFLHYRPSRIRHDAQIAAERCPGQVRDL